jgi:hypothetical protein
MDTNSEAPFRTLTAMEAAAERGVDLLDDVRPNWRTRVNFDTVDMSDPDACIIGQTENGPYTFALSNLMDDARIAGYNNDSGDTDDLYAFEVAFGFDHFIEHDASAIHAKVAWMRAM